MTPHNNATSDQIAKIVLMPGDPLRAKYIAEHYLNHCQLVNSVRNCLAYTGTYKDIPITIMASGMGMPSIGIYSYELYKFYDVDTIIRVGSCGGYTKDLHTFDVVLVKDCYSESSYAKVQSHDEDMIQYPDPIIHKQILDTAKQLDIRLKEIRMHSSDVFYHEDEDAMHQAIEKGCKAVEMESFALFHNAKITNKKAACICTVSDSFVYDEQTTPKQRETAFDTMIKLALESACQIK